MGVCLILVFYLVRDLPWWKYLPVALFFCLPVYPFIKRHLPAVAADLVTAVVLLAAAALSLLSVVGTTYNPFIYFNF